MRGVPVNTDEGSSDLSKADVPADIRAEFKRQMEAGNIEVWSCDPSLIQPWTDEGKQRLHAVLADTFGWEKHDEAKGQDGRADEGTIPNPVGDGEFVESERDSPGA